jgi:metal-dependent HD superfamily phosphatase/phosphodiesterase
MGAAESLAEVEDSRVVVEVAVSRARIGNQIFVDSHLHHSHSYWY